MLHTLFSLCQDLGPWKLQSQKELVLFLFFSFVAAQPHGGRPPLFIRGMASGGKKKKLSLCPSFFCCSSLSPPVWGHSKEAALCSILQYPLKNPGLHQELNLTTPWSWSWASWLPELREINVLLKRSSLLYFVISSPSWPSSHTYLYTCLVIHRTSL